MARVYLDLAVIQQHWHRDSDLLFRVPQHLVEPRLEVEKVGSAVEPRHHRFERVLLVQEAILVGANDAIGWESKVSGHGINQGVRAGPTVENGWKRNEQ